MTPTEIVLAVFGVLGAFAVGSFLCVVIERMPVLLDEPDRFGDLYGMRPWGEVLGGSSRCSGCGADIRPYDKIPTISWLVLRGKCRTCGDRIPGFHPLVELAVPLVGVGVVAALGWEARTLPALWLVPVGIAVAAIDLRTFMVPTKIVWPAFFVSVAMGLLVATTVGETRWLVGGVIGIAALAGPLALLWLVVPDGMGFGDVRLATLIGWTVGFVTVGTSWWSVVLTGVVTLALAAVIGIVVGLVVLGLRGRKAKVPFGPALVGAAFVSLAIADSLANAYGVA